MKRIKIAIFVMFLLVLTAEAYALEGCFLDGYVFYANGTPVIKNTTYTISSINLTDQTIISGPGLPNPYTSGTYTPLNQSRFLPGNSIACSVTNGEIKVQAWDSLNDTPTSQANYTGINTTTTYVFRTGSLYDVYINVTLDTPANPNVSLESNSTSIEIETTQNASYLLNITNLGSVNDSFNITYTTNASLAYVNATTIEDLEPDTSWYVLLNVSDPTPGTYATNITAFSISNESVNETLEIQTNVSVGIVRGVNMTINVSDEIILTDGNATFLLNITNNGTYTDNYTITNSTTANNAWLNETTITDLAAGASYSILLYIWDSIAGNYETNVTAVSDNDAEANATVTAQVEIQPIIYNASVSVNPSGYLQTYNDSNATYTITITNIGNKTDNFTITNSTNASNAWLNQTTIEDLAPKDSFDVILNITDGTEGYYETNVTATSDTDTKGNGTGKALTQVIEITYDVTIVPDSPTKTAINTTNATYTLTITNTGTVTETYTIINSTNSSNAWLSQSSITLNAGQNRQVKLNVTDTVPGYYETNITVYSQTIPTYNDSTTVITHMVSGPLAEILMENNESGTVQIYNNSYALYEINLTNTGQRADNITLENITNATTVSLNQTFIEQLGVDESFIVLLNVSDNVPASYATNVTAYSENNDTYRNYTMAYTNIQPTPIYNITLDVTPSFAEGYNVTYAYYTLNITNYGNYADTVVLTNTSNASNISYSQTTVSGISPNGGWQTVTVGVSDNTEARYETNITATSQGNTSVNDTVTIETNVTEAEWNVSVSANTTYAVVIINQQAHYQINVTNTGNIAETYTVTKSSNASNSNIAGSVGPLGIGESGYLTLTISNNLPEVILETNITVTSDSDPRQNDTITLETNVSDTPPTQPTIDLTPNSPITGDTLTCTVTSPSTDLETSPVQYYYEWYKNSVLSTTHGPKTSTTDNLASSNTAEGEEWNCTVVPFDGGQNGTASITDPVTIGNTPPTINVDLTPDVASTKQNLTCIGIYHDVDNDAPSTVNYAFTGDYSDTGSASCYSLGGGQYNCTANVTSDNTVERDNITCTMTPYDDNEVGTADSDWVEISWVYAPSHFSVTINETDQASTIITWDQSQNADYYALYWDANSTKLFEMDPYERTPNLTTTKLNYSDMEAPSVLERYYRVAAVKLPAYEMEPGIGGKKNKTIKKGKNLISLPVIPESNLLNDIVAPPAGSEYDRISTYTPGTGWQRSDYYGDNWKWFGDFDTMETDRGYFLYPTTQQYIIPMTGNISTENRTIYVNQGYNLIGWTSIFEKKINDILIPPGNEDRISRYDPDQGWERTDYYEPYGWYGRFENFEPGEGYWFYPTEQTYEWEYDPRQ